MFYQQKKWIDFSDQYISKNITVGIKHKASDFCFSMKRVHVQTRDSQSRVGKYIYLATTLLIFISVNKW